MIFLGTIFVLVASLVIGVIALWHGKGTKDDFATAGSNLRALEIGLSAGATGNSGFIVTAGVALGYVYGLTFCLLPVCWLLGELLFWRFFAGRLREKAICNEDKSILGLLAGQAGHRAMQIAVALVTIGGLALYAASQIVVGQALLRDGLGLESDVWPVLLLGVMTVYVLVGGFRSTVWTDIFQAIMMLLLTVGCLAGFGFVALRTSSSSLTWAEIVPFRGWPTSAIVAFVVTWIVAGAGFGLSQPHVAERYIAAKNDRELRSAMWIYNVFLQFTWLGMTLAGVLLRAVHPGAGYDEGILMTSLGKGFNPLLFGLIIGAMLCAVMSTVDSILHSSGLMLTSSLLGHGGRSVFYIRIGACIVAVVVGILFLSREETVFSLSSLAVTFLTASLAPAVLLRLFSNARSGAVLATVVIGSASYIAWSMAGAGKIFGVYFPRFELVPAFVTTLPFALFACKFGARSK